MEVQGDMGALEKSPMRNRRGCGRYGSRTKRAANEALVQLDIALRLLRCSATLWILLTPGP